jgi:hypothetical protein
MHTHTVNEKYFCSTKYLKKFEISQETFLVHLAFILHSNENPIYVFLFLELRSLSPNFRIQVSVSDLYIPRIGPHI